MNLNRIPATVRWIPLLGFLLASAAAAQTICTAASEAGEAAFLASNDAAMTKMMDGMVLRPTGDVDTDFSAMMIPHHQGAIEMAEAELRWGRNEQLRRIAQEIIVDQQQEIAAMRLALGQTLPASEPAPTGSATPPQASPPRTAHHSLTMPTDHSQ